MKEHSKGLYTLSLAAVTRKRLHGGLDVNPRGTQHSNSFFCTWFEKSKESRALPSQPPSSQLCAYPKTDLDMLLRTDIHQPHAWVEGCAVHEHTPAPDERFAVSEARI